jgi:threonine dehydrogenase-like Zn-dependent dehydrogenase
MKGVVLKENHQLALEEVPEPRIENDGDIIIRVTTATICGSDVHIKHGVIPGIPIGMVIGHEFVGVVEEVGKSVTKFRPGDRVAAPCAAWCGVCPECQRGYVTYCSHGGIWAGGPFFGPGLQGAQTQYIRAPYGDVYLSHIPGNVPDEQAVFVGDILATGYQGAYEGKISPGDTVVVFGCGPVGLCAIISAWQFGPKEVIAVDALDYRLSKAKHYGARTIDAKKGNVLEEIKEATKGVGADTVIEAIGNIETFKQALKAVRRSGTVSVVGLFPTSVDFPIQDLGFYGVRISMGLVHPNRMGQLLGLLEKGRIDLAPLGTHTFPLDRALEAYELFEYHPDQCVKMLIKP